ncbi:phosphotransferase family protein [Pelagibius sp.]|uniref:phosphotransferase family protein n=1 Tax=Pelagibius sp. TaxID=1931238 RepID=UPI003B50D1A6
MRDDWERQEDLIDLSAADIAALLQPAFPGVAIESVAPAKGGKANTNVRVELATPAGPVLLRLFVRDPAAGAKEVAILRRLAGQVPVPKVHAFAPDNAVTGHPYAILDWVEGRRMDLALSAARSQLERCQMAAAVGETLARIGALTFPQAGFLSGDLAVSQGFETGTEGFRSFVGEMTGRPRVAQRLTPALTDELLRFVQEAAVVLDGPPGPARLTHCDYDPSNILLRREDTGWRVAAVLDWEFAVAATPLLDLGHMLRAPQGEDPLFVAALGKGFRAGGGALPKHWVAAARLLDLLAWLDFLDRPVERPRLFADARSVIRTTIDSWPALLAQSDHDPMPPDPTQND